MNWTDIVSIISAPCYDPQRVKELEKKKGKKFKISFTTKVSALLKLLASFVSVLLFWPALFRWVSTGDSNWMVGVVVCLVTAAVADILLERSNKKDEKNNPDFSRI